MLYVGHPFGGKKAQAGIVSTSGDDFQDLLAAADALITDYSSALFDYIGLGRPFCLFMKDFDRYQRTRGLYSEPLVDLKKFIAYDESAIAPILAMGSDSSDRAIFDKYSDAGGGSAAIAVVNLVERIKREITDASTANQTE